MLTDKRLFTPLPLRGVTLRNRIVLAPMLTYQATGGALNDAHLVHLGKMAAGGVGLVFTESTKVDPRGLTTVRDLGLWKDEFVEPFRRVTSLVKQLGAVPGIQLSHSGRKARVSVPWEGRAPILQDMTVDGSRKWELIGPSAIPHSADFQVPREMTADDIGEVVEAFGQAARRAHEAGFEVIEVHAAHGYLVHQFYSPGANHRTDRYGGSLENRMRFALEVADSIRRWWPSEKPLFFRISATDTLGWTLADSVQLSRALKEHGVDVIDCSDGGMERLTGGNLSGGKPDYGYQVRFSEAIRHDASVKTMAVGLIVHAQQAERIIAEERADLVALGRELLHNPNWPVDAAQKLGGLPSDAGVPPNYGFWLDKRATGTRIVPSTWTAGDEPTAPAAPSARSSLARP